MSCWLAQFSDVPCHGRLVKGHLIPKQRVKRELHRAQLQPGARRHGLSRGEMDAVVWDDRVWVPMCGGYTGLAGHHGMFDAKRLTVARSELPEGLEAFAEQYGLGWSLDRDFGLREAVS